MVGQINAIHIPRNALSLFTLFNQKKSCLLFVCSFRIAESLLIARPDENYQAQSYVYIQQYKRFIISLHKDVHVKMHRFIKFLDRSQHFC